MANNRGDRSNRADSGFTLIELAVVVIIIGVLIGIGIPTFFGARDHAAEASAKSAVTHGLKTEKVFASDAAQSFTDDPAQLHEIEPSLKFDTDYTQAVTTGPVNNAQVLGKVYIRQADGTVVTLVSRSSTGRCFWTKNEAGVTTYAVNDCSGDPTVFGSSW